MRRFGLVIAIMLVAGACSASTLDAEDLAAMVLTESDAPEGMSFVPAESGELILDDLTNDDAERADLLADGFVSGFDAIFASPGLAGVEGDISRSNSRIVDSSAFLFETDEGAESSFARLRTSAEETFATFGAVSDVAVDGLGLDAYGIRVDITQRAGPDVGVIHSWRVENVILQVVLWGVGIDAPEARALVDIVNGRLSN